MNKRVPRTLNCHTLTSCDVGGQVAQRYLLTNEGGVQVELMSFGATLLSVAVPDRNDTLVPINRGLSAPARYTHNPAYMGSICGRYAGRIAHGRFKLQGEEVVLTQNSQDHHLHGGTVGFNARGWSARSLLEPDRVGVELTYVSEAGEEGYPGELQCQVSYWLDNDSRLTIGYRAEVREAPTVVNLTNHCYWNLSSLGHIYDHELQIRADQVLEFDADTLPTGKLLDVRGSACDFTEPRRLGDKMQALPATALGFDHCFVTRPAATSRLREVAHLRDPESERELRVSSDQPALVLYTGNYLDGSADVGGLERHGAVCLEVQQYPDAPNHPSFPSTVVSPDRPYSQTTIYQFFHA